MNLLGNILLTIICISPLRNIEQQPSITQKEVPSTEWVLVEKLLKQIGQDRLSQVVLQQQGSIYGLDNNNITDFVDIHNIPYQRITPDNNVKSLVPIALALDASNGCIASLNIIDENGIHTDKAILITGMDNVYVYIYDYEYNENAKIDRDSFFEWWSGFLVAVYRDEDTKNRFQYIEPTIE